MEKGTQYRTLLIQAIHACAAKFADVAERCVHTQDVALLFFSFLFRMCDPGHVAHDSCHSRWHSGPQRWWLLASYVEGSLLQWFSNWRTAALFLVHRMPIIYDLAKFRVNCKLPRYACFRFAGFTLLN